MKDKINLYLLCKNPAKRGIFVLLMFFLSSGFSAFSQAIAKVDKPKYDFGRVKKGEIVKMEFTVRNVGNAPLILKNYEVACSCTSVEYETKPVLPNEQTIVKVNFDTKTVYERQDRNVFIYYNSDKKGVIKLRFKGYVEKN